MLRIPCPHCGIRDHVEFTYGGDASMKRPDTTAAMTDTQWTDYLYRRSDPAGPHLEYWHHTSGCRQWLRVARNTIDHSISSVEPPHTPDRDTGR